MPIVSGRLIIGPSYKKLNLGCLFRCFICTKDFTQRILVVVIVQARGAPETPVSREV